MIFISDQVLLQKWWKGNAGTQECYSDSQLECDAKHGRLEVEKIQANTQLWTAIRILLNQERMNRYWVIVENIAFHQSDHLTTWEHQTLLTVNAELKIIYIFVSFTGHRDKD